MSVRNYQFDLTGMSPEERQCVAEVAQAIVHMEEGAGRIMAQKLLPVRDLLDGALAAVEGLENIDGFGHLPTGFCGRDARDAVPQEIHEEKLSCAAG